MPAPKAKPEPDPTPAPPPADPPKDPDPAVQAGVRDSGKPKSKRSAPGGDAPAPPGPLPKLERHLSWFGRGSMFGRKKGP